MDTNLNSGPMRLPLLTVLLAGIAAFAALDPVLGTALEFDRTAIAHGQYWRVFSGHCSHWTNSHLAWDLAAFTILGILLERRSRGLLTGTLALSALAISAAVAWLEPELETYRGLSGIDSALFAALALRSLADGHKSGSLLSQVLPAVALLGLFAKFAVESFLSAPLLVAPNPDFVPVPLAHLVGAVAGLAAAACTLFPIWGRRYVDCKCRAPSP